jgi:hypothetical protein
MTQPFPEDLVIRSFDDIADALSAIKNHRNLSNETVEQIAGTCAGFCNKYLGRSREKRIGPVAFNLLMGALGLEFLVRQAPDAEKMRHRWEPRRQDHVRNNHRVSQTLIDKIRPIVLSELGRKGAEVTNKLRAQRRNGRRLNGHNGHAQRP